MKLEKAMEILYDTLDGGVVLFVNNYNLNYCSHKVSTM